MSRQLIMLDFDGVIADSLDVMCDAFVRSFAMHGPARLASPDAVLSMLDHNWFEGMARAGLTADASVALDAAVMDWRSRS